MNFFFFYKIFFFFTYMKKPIAENRLQCAIRDDVTRATVCMIQNFCRSEICLASLRVY